MRLVPLRHDRIDPATGVEMDWVARLTTEGRAQVHFARFTTGESLPRHPAPSWQVFAVVEGEGWVAADDDVRVPVAAGTAVVWSPGEQHTSGTEVRMAVVIVQTSIEPEVPAR